MEVEVGGGWSLGMHGGESNGGAMIKALDPCMKMSS